MKWISLRLKEAPIRFIDGDRSSKYPKRSEFQESGVFFLNANSISGGRFNPDLVNFISPEKFETILKGRVDKGDVIMTTRGNGVGDCTYFDRDDDALINAQMLILRTNPAELNSKFLYYLLTSRNNQELLRNFVSGSAQPQLPISSLKEVSILFPPLPTQKKIASILSAYDDLIENNLKRIRLLEEAAQNLYREWFVHMRFPGHESATFGEDGLPEGWEKINLYDFAEIQMGYPFKANDFNEDGIGIPAIRIRDIPNQWTRTFTTQNANDEYKTSKGDIVVGMDGFFYTDVWCGQDEAFLVQRVCRIRADNSDYQGFLLESLKEPIAYYEKTISGATVAHLGAKHLKEISISLPASDIQNQLRVFNDLMNLKIKLRSQIISIKEARDILLPRLMNQTILV